MYYVEFIYLVTSFLYAVLKKRDLFIHYPELMKQEIIIMIIIIINYIQFFRIIRVF